MKLAVKDLDIGTGGPLIAVLHSSDAQRMDLHFEDRVRLSHGKRRVVAILDITSSQGVVRQGVIGLMDELVKELGVRDGQNIEVQLEQKPASLQHIRSKLDGACLSEEQLGEIVYDITRNKLSEIEIAYFVASTYIRGLNADEVAALTKAMVKYGETLDFPPPVMDKHSIGGVPGNRTTMVVVPIVAAAGLTIPKTSSRAITSAAGTADVMEVLARVEVPLPELRHIVKRVGACMVWGGALALAPADDRIIRVESPLSLDAEGQMIASVLAKKRSVGATHVLIDIPVGAGAKVWDMERGERLRGLFEGIGKQLGMEVHVLLTDGAQPIGNGIGSALEARDVLWILLGDERAPADLRKKSIMMAGKLLEMGAAAPLGEGAKLAEELLRSGKAYRKMVEIIDAQGRRASRPEELVLGRQTEEVRAARPGTIRSADNKFIARIARALGSPKDQGAGVYLHVHVGDRVKKGDTLFTLYADSSEKLGHARALLSASPFDVR